MALLEVTASQLAALQRVIQRELSGELSARPDRTKRREFSQVVDLEIGKGTISAASSGGTPGSGTFTVWDFTTTGGVAATTETVTAYNFSLEATDSSHLLFCARHKRSSNFLVLFEDCATT